MYIANHAVLRSIAAEVAKTMTGVRNEIPYNYEMNVCVYV